ncbi:GGDEF domain-containing protein [Anaeromyxobacter oryzae]|uniref:GGDEF domain-containing protein n=1 Tax=Anaeromyxobacter oryzae TaxID=2918170 RepID=UPI0020BD4BB9|nr:GGDEF domain-containing protein [Anaeromyxobacter oryzae]
MEPILPSRASEPRKPAASRAPAPTPVPTAEAARPGALSLTPAGWLVSAFGMILCVGAGDYLTRSDVSLILFYLAPIGFGTWFASLRGGIVLSFASAGVSTGADVLYRFQHTPADLALPTLVWNGLMLLGTSLALVLVLGALKGRLEGEELLARTDALTQIANRRAFFEAASLELERARRHGRPLTIAYVDLDDFKLVNDRLGHAEGDALLVTVAQTLRHATRAVDAVARLGGDEFGLLLPEADAAMAEALLARLRATLLAAVERHGGWNVGFSIGAAVFLAPPANVDELTARADELMYLAKRHAKGSIRIGVFEDASSFLAGGEA